MSVAALRARARRRSVTVHGVAVLVVFGLFALSVMVGSTFYTPVEVIQVITGQTVPGASFAVGEVRLPRAILCVLAGVCYGMGGYCFQTLLRNQLASPDIIGISAGASAVGVVCLVMLGWGQNASSIAALVGGLAVAGIIYGLSHKGGFSGARLILIGIGIAAMLMSVITFTLSKAAAWDLGTATRWITGSVNGATWERVLPVALCCLVVIPLMALASHALGVVRLGDDAAAGLGTDPHRVRLLLMGGAVLLIAVATASTGPISFVAFMAGPIAAKLLRGGTTALVLAALIGAVIVLAADIVGQHLLGTRYPVGVITGMCGAPFLLSVLIRSHQGRV